MQKEYPKFISGRLNEIVLAFRKRSKAIKHHACSIEFTKENKDGLERLNIDAEHLNSPPVQIRISIWGDNEFYFGMHQSAKLGWKIQIQFNGNATGINPKDIVLCFENTLHKSDRSELLEVWKCMSPS